MVKPLMILLIVPILSYVMIMSGCAPNEPNVLDQLGTVQITLKDQKFELWVADESNELSKGLMFITDEQMAPLPDGTERGMIFVFDHEQPLGFWMKNTIIPLDIAYVDSDGIVVSIHTMPALVTRTFPSGNPAQFAIEVNASVFKQISLNPGDQIELPDSILKRFE